VRLDIGKYCFSNRVCDEWNRLPGEIVNEEVSTVSRVNWISTTGASGDLNKLWNNFIPRY